VKLENLENHIKTLASDEFMGRMPFTEGETKTINYLRDEFEKLGLQPGNGNEYFQEVPLVEITAKVSPLMKISGGKEDLEFNYWKEFVTLTRRVTDSVDVQDSELIFAGYGIVAPEYDWNDYENLDVEGKTVVVLVNDPGFGTTDSSFFKGNEMTYYGRWTYKYEEAARQGATGCIIIHETAPASYPWFVVQGGWSGPNMYLQSKDNNMSRCAIEGWISKEAAEKLFSNAGMDEYDYFEEGRKREFESFSLKQNCSVSLTNSIERSTSNNVMAKLEGKTRPEEYIIYTAHWDHFGFGTVVEGDSIYNGAVDNASGTAALIELARCYSELQEKPDRSVLFLAVTAEEQGLLGAAHYAANPVYPPQNTIANINMDAFRPIGRTKDFVIVGYGQSELEDLATVAAEKQGRYVSPYPKPEEGSFFRSDHFCFAKIGVPALYGKGGTDHREKGKEYGEEMYAKYTAEDYHKPSDEWKESLNIEGVVEDVQVFFEVGYRLATEDINPDWKEGSEFKAIRQASLENKE
jgi:Zn-dependent M28 family amino/carboxypeptidase